MKKKKLLVLVLSLLLLLFGVGYLMLVPFVEYREPELPSSLSSRLSSPKSSFSFLVGREGGLLRKIRKPALIVYSPLSPVVEEDVPTLQWGRVVTDADYSFILDKEEMYRSVLDEYEGRTIGFLYVKDDMEGEEIYQKLSAEYPNLVEVKYFERVSVVNRDEIIESLDNLWGVIVFDASSSREAWVGTKARVIMDNISASSALGQERIISIEPDWNDVIKSALKGEDISLHYTFAVLDNL